MTNLKNIIYVIRNKQVILDSDVSELYQYETKVINQTVKRNISRFPGEFCFQLTNEEYELLRSQFASSSLENNEQRSRSQIVTLNKSGNKRGINLKYLPYVFTEKGVIMLAGLLKNDIAIEASIRIVEAFVEMKKFITGNADVFKRLTTVEYKLIEHDEKFNTILTKLEGSPEMKEKLFYDGEIYDAYSLIVEIFKKAEKQIVIIDNYIEKKVLDMLTCKQDKVNVTIITKNNKLKEMDIEKFNSQYGYISIGISDRFHDRFVIIDNKELYHVGASIKDMGKKCFGINKIEDLEYLNRLVEIINDKSVIFC